MSKKRNTFTRRLLFLTIVGFAAWYFYAHWWPLNNPQKFDGRLESAVNQELTRLGITDRDVLSQVRKEHRLYKSIAWVETERTLQVSSTERMLEVSHALERVAERLGCSFEKDQSPSGLEIRIKRLLLGDAAL